MLSKIAFTAAALIASASVAAAASFPYQPQVSLKLGQSVVLKGVRGQSCDGPAMSWADVASHLPKPKHGKFSDGGLGTVNSASCGKSVAARGVKFTAKKPGTVHFKIYGDPISITVSE